MNTKTIWIAVAPIALLALTAGCGSSSGGGSSLTNAQVMMLVQAMGSARNSGSGALMDNTQFHATDIDHSGTHHHPNTTTTITPTTANCADGGTASVSGSIDSTLSGSTLTISSLDFSVTMTGCENTGSDGNTYTVNSDGAMTITGSGSYTTSPSLSGNSTSTESGTVTVTGTNLNVTCAINLAVTETTSGTSISASVIGTVCGNTVNLSATE